MASVCRWNLEQDDRYFLRDLCPQEGGYCQGYQVESRRPLRGVCRRLVEPRPEQDIDLIQELRATVIPGLGWRTQSYVVDGSEPTEKYR